jgi:hypothetical protein
LPPGQPPETPFVGRARHLAALEEAFAASRQGRSVVVSVCGRSGLGKSALVGRFLQGLRERGEAVVLTGRCYERESVPYKALDSLVDALGQYLRQLPRPEADGLLPRDTLALTRLFPVLQEVEAVAGARRWPSDAPPDHQELRRRAFAALRELLARLGDRRPLVLAIDDLQWGDADSAALLGELLRPPDPPVLLLVGCYRSEDSDTSAFLRALVQSQEQAGAGIDRREVVVEELTPAEAGDLARALLGGHGAAAAGAAAVARESGGNPFFVNELVQYLRAGAGLAGLTPAGAPVLETVLGERIGRLPDEAQQLLEVLAVAGRPLPETLVCQATALAGRERTAFGLLRYGHLVRGTGSGTAEALETFHDRIRETVLARLPPAVLRERHGQLAAALEAAHYPDPEPLALHFHGAGDARKAGHYYVLAADQAAEALAFERAAKLYRLALDLGAGARPEDSGLRSRLGDALANAGRGVEAAREYQAAAAGADAAFALDLQRRAAYQYLISGHLDDGLAALDAVLKGVGLRLPATPRRALAGLLLRRGWLRLRGLRFRERDTAAVPPKRRLRVDVCWSTSIGLGLVDIIRASDFQTRCLLLALRAGDPFRVTRALALEAIYTAGEGCRARRRTTDLLRAAEGLAARVDHPYARGIVSLARAATAWLQGRYREALAAAAAAEEVFRGACTGVAWELDTAQVYRLVSLVSLGEVGELSRLAPAFLREAQERGDLYLATNVSAHALPLVGLATDNPESAAAELQQAMARWSQRGFHIQHLMALISETDIALYRGDARAARARLEAQWPAYTRSLLPRVQGSHIQALYARARAAVAAAAVAADPGPLRAAAGRDAVRLDRENTAASRALAGLVRAGLCYGRGDAGAARGHLVRAVPQLDAVGAGLHAAAARRRLGLLLGGSEGTTMLKEGAAWMAARGIRNPARMTATLLPGFAEQPG